MIKKVYSYGIIPVFKHAGKLKFLALKHKNGGHWGFPKGHAEEGESPILAAQRELAEEAGITDIDIVGGKEFIQKYGFSKDGKIYHKTVIYFLGITRSMAVEPQPEEIADYRWSDLTELNGLLVVEGKNNEVVDQLEKFFSSKSI